MYPSSTAKLVACGLLTGIAAQILWGGHGFCGPPSKILQQLISNGSAPTLRVDGPLIGLSLDACVQA